MKERKIITAISDKKEIKKKVLETPIDAQEKLSAVMTDKPKEIKVGNKTCYINALRMGTQWLISEEAVKIVKVENANMGDILAQFKVNIPSVIHCITLAILNDKDKIFKNQRRREYTDEYYSMYEDIMWKSDRAEWMNILFEVMNMIDVEVFFYTTDAIQMIREMTLKRKMMRNEVN